MTLAAFVGCQVNELAPEVSDSALPEAEMVNIFVGMEEEDGARVHPTQKPVEIISRFVKALSYPGSVVLDFFAGSGTVGRVCITEGRHCLMCDSDEATIEYFNKHLKRMRGLEQKTEHTRVDDVERFFTYYNKGELS